jgi:GLPGLI family protein
MKSFISFLIIISGFANNLSSQKIYGIVNYKIKLGEDNLFFDAKLKFNSKKSCFVYKQRNISKWKINKGSTENDDTELVSQKVYTDTIGHIVIKELHQPFLLIRDFCEENQPVIYKDSVKINWEITDSTKEIEGVKCMLATAKFRGRNYHAWFALSIPLPFGPWKFGGLPGMIVEIQDDKKEVLIKLQSISLNSKSKDKLDISENLPGKKTSLNKICKCKDKEWEKMIEKEAAFFAKMNAEYPDFEIETDIPDRRPATELNLGE